MWRKSSVMVAVLVIVASVGGVGPRPPMAWAGGRNEPISGDVNGDGLQDRVYLGVVQPGSCSVIIEYGLPSGGYGNPIAYTYLRPGGESGLSTPCPDVGVAVDLEADGIEDVVIAWFPGPPTAVSFNMLVLGRTFQPSFGLRQSIVQPSFMGTADFNGDGRPDVYSVTDQGQGFESYYSLGNGTLTPGPEKFCSGPFTYLLNDFNRDGSTDVVISYLRGCDDDSSGVVTVDSDGTVQQLQLDPLGAQTWTSALAYANGDSWVDIRTTSVTTGEIDYFIQVPGADPARFVESPTAVQDKVTIQDSQKTNIAVLANDYATTSARVIITTPPKHGTVRVSGSRTVLYTPNASHGSSDRFVYQITEGTKTSVAPVNIRFTD